MAYSLGGGKITVPAAPQSLLQALGLTSATVGQGLPDPGPGYRVLVIRADSANAARTYLGKPTAGAPGTSAVTSAGANAIGYLAAGDGLGIDLQAGGISFLSNFFIVGNGADLLYALFYE